MSQGTLFGEAHENQKEDAIKKQAGLDLIRIADQMETAQPGSHFYKALKRDYSAALHRAGITDAMGNYKGRDGKGAEIKSEIIHQRKCECFDKIIAALESFAEWEASIKKLYIGELGHIAFSYNANHKGIGYEIQFMVTDHFYRDYSGYAATKNRVNLLSARQLKGYPTLEFGLLHFGYELAADKPAFWTKYITPYNERIKSKK